MCLAAAALSLSCHGPDPLPVAPDASVDSDVVLDLTLSSMPAAEFELPAPAPIARPSTSVLVTDHRTEVQMAPGFYPSCFSEARQERRRARLLFNRRQSESEILRRNPVPGLAEITRLVLGRIILSEANWPHDERFDHSAPDQNHAEVDAPLIYQVLRYTRRDGETLLGAMRRHAPHMSEARPVSTSARSRMRWTVEMQLSCRRPPHFPTLAADGGELDWENDYAPRCRALFALAQDLLDGDRSAVGDWANAPIITWGGRCEDVHGACDDDQAVGRGLVPYETGDTANRFWCRPGDGCVGEPLVVAGQPN